MQLNVVGYRRLNAILSSLNWLYNQALEQRKTAWEQRQESLTFYAQCKWLTVLRDRNEQGLGEFALGPQRGMLKRLDEAFKSFFRRAKAGQAPGFPRFRPIRRCLTIDVTNVGKRMIRTHGKYHVVKIKGFPQIRLYSSRPLPHCDSLKAVRLTKRGRHWEASLVYAVDKQPLEPSVSAVGIDLGVRKRMTLSDGTRHKGHNRGWKHIRRAQRAVARCKKGSRTRRKRSARLSRYRRKEFVAQRNELHRATTGIIRSHGLVAVEKLKLRNMTRAARGTAAKPGSNVRQKAGLNRSINEQNWGLLRNQLAYKAGWAGREYVEVNPAYTSQDCSRCRARNDPGSAETYRCNPCGLTMDRDVNAAINILAAGVIAAGASTWVAGPCVAPEPYPKVTLRHYWI